MTTALEIPAMRIVENLGVCYGLIVRSLGFSGPTATTWRTEEPPAR
jgi:hypothetical protein